MEARTALQNPHDHLFHHTFAEPKHAASLLRVAAPLLAAVVDQGIEAASAILVDARLERREADLLFRAQLGSRRRGEGILFLVEHKSEAARQLGVGRDVVLQVLGYAVRIWEALVAKNPRRRQLPPILSVVLHHGSRLFDAPTRLSELLDHVEGVPPMEFEFVLIDLTRYGEEAILALDLTPVAALTLLHLQFARTMAPDQLVAALRRWARCSAPRRRPLPRSRGSRYSSSTLSKSATSAQPSSPT